MSEDEKLCKYFADFEDVQTSEYREYSCQRLALNSGYCEFHDENFLIGNEDKVRLLFENHVNASTNPTNELLCIGFHLPEIDLQNLRFQNAVYFVNTKFHGDVNFSKSTFTAASFYKAEFYGEVSFFKLNFEENFIFSDVKSHNGPIEFKNIVFNQKSSFTRFESKNTVFNNCDFHVTTFRGSKFEDGVKFLETNFTMKADFSDIQFDSEADFSNTVFSKNTNFKFTKFNSTTKIHNVDFKEQKLVAFDDNLANVSFKNTDITRIKFDEKTIWGRPDRYEVYDARELIKNPEKIGLGSVLAIYRNLRENYEFRLMYEEAGQFFVREMELKRNYREDPKEGYKTKLKPSYHRYLSLISIYSVLCRYGESFKRPSFWAGLIFASAFIYRWFTSDLSAITENYSLETIEEVSKMMGDYLIQLEIITERTLSSFFQSDSNDLADYIVKILSIPVLGTLFIVLRRRFERRFRH